MEETVLITGASGGIGLELAWLFARDGCRLLLTARNEERLMLLKQQMENTCLNVVDVLPLDLSEPGASEELLRYIEEKKLFIGTLVNNAGFGDFGSFSDCDIKKQQEMIQLNISTLVRLTHGVLKPMQEQRKGKILNVASIASFVPGPLMSVYYASKAFVLSFSEAIATELKGSGITVTALCPGPTETGFQNRASLERSGLFHNLKVADAKSVAQYGYRAMKKGKLIAIPGFFNRLVPVATRIVPRKLVRTVVRQIQK